MTIRPLDMQTNISQMHEVGRAEQARNASLLAQQSVLGEESTKLENLKKERLDESEKAEDTKFRDVLDQDEKRKRKEEEKQNANYNDDTVQGEGEPKYDPDKKYGRFLDVLR